MPRWAADLVAALPAYVDVTSRDSGGATITVATGDGHQLYDLLLDLALHKVPLVSVTPTRPTLEDVFMRLVGDETR